MQQMKIIMGVLLAVSTASAQEPSQVCYPGMDSPLCIERADRSSIDSSSAGEYRYLSPSRSNGFPGSFNRRQYQVPSFFADLSTRNGSEWIAPFFKIEEFMAAYKGKYGIFSRGVIERLHRIREEINGPLIINSAFRGPAYNKQIGGAKWSRHVYGDGVDLSMNSADTLNGLKQKCLRNGASFTQIYATHIHCDWRNQPLDSAYYGTQFDKDGVSPKPVAELLAEMSRTELISVKRSEVVVGVLHPKAEDPGQLLYEWQVTDGQGTNVFQTYEPILRLPRPETGLQVTVIVGGSVVVKNSFDLTDR